MNDTTLQFEYPQYIAVIQDDKVGGTASGTPIPNSSDVEYPDVQLFHLAVKYLDEYVQYQKVSITNTSTTETAYNVGVYGVNVNNNDVIKFAVEVNDDGDYARNGVELIKNMYIEPKLHGQYQWHECDYSNPINVGQLAPGESIGVWLRLQFKHLDDYAEEDYFRLGVKYTTAEYESSSSQSILSSSSSINNEDESSQSQSQMTSSSQGSSLSSESSESSESSTSSVTSSSSVSDETSSSSVSSVESWGNQSSGSESSSSSSSSSKSSSGSQFSSSSSSSSSLSTQSMSSGSGSSSSSKSSSSSAFEIYNNEINLIHQRLDGVVDIVRWTIDESNPRGVLLEYKVKDLSSYGIDKHDIFYAIYVDRLFLKENIGSNRVQVPLYDNNVPVLIEVFLLPFSGYRPNLPEVPSQYKNRVKIKWAGRNPGAYDIVKYLLYWDKATGEYENIAFADVDASEGYGGGLSVDRVSIETL